MFPEQAPFHKAPPKLPLRQRGYLMPLAIFIVVIMGIFTATLSRTTSQTAIATSQEAITLQAFYAAESGAQLGMNTLFYDTATTLSTTVVDARCTGLSLNPNYAVAGLSNCSATVSCTRDGNIQGVSYYTLTSIGQCGAGTIQSTRAIDVSARMEGP